MKPLQITSLGQLHQHIANCQNKAESCHDAITMLTGMTPEDFKFTFTIKGSTVLTFEMGENDLDVCMAFFTYFYQYYSRTHKTLLAMLPDAAGKVL